METLRNGQKEPIEAVAYLRTSSAANLGADKDSDKRQREAIAAFAKHNGYVIASEYFDAAVSGADPIDDRPGFKALIERIASNGVRTVIVEDASRFARTLMVQEAGIAILVSMGVRVLPCAQILRWPTALRAQVTGETVLQAPRSACQSGQPTSASRSARASCSRV